MNCILCDRSIDYETTGEPILEFNNKNICYDCYMEIIPVIYGMAGAGDGGMIHLIFKQLLVSNHNRKHRKQISQYNKILKELLHKYNFQCVECGTSEELTIDHIKPVSKGGTDDIGNLQIMCKSCNSKKGNKYDG